ncbi:MAG: hypothetical protein LAP13_06620 [Acidobacteriia bacterium]|nr:hypothetical protein [Terriglobia bacterium]
MGRSLSWAVSALVFSAEALYAGQAAHLVRQMPAPGSVSGHVTVVETINRKTAANPVRDLKVYLFTYEATRPFRELQQKCRRAMAHPAADPVRTYQLCDQALAEAYALVPNLPAIATAQTDRDGTFQFDNVSPGREYHLIGIKPAEGGSPIVVVETIKGLYSGGKVRLELSENDPWTGPLVLK